eukprot:13435068-Heterocapsa_arctica.AAC.1
MVTEDILSAFVCWLREANVGDMRLRYVEPSLKARASQLAARSRAKDFRTVIVESSPTKSTPPSPYSVEHYAQTITDLLRTHIVDVQHRFSRTIVASSRLMPWL